MTNPIDYGTVEVNGATVSLTEAPYVTRLMGYQVCERDVYTCDVEHKGQRYTITWGILDGFDGNDESNACDWGEYDVTAA